MRQNFLVTGLVAAALLGLPERSVAQNDVVIEGLRLFNNIIENSQPRQQPQQVVRQAPRQAAAPRMSDWERQQNREVQAALNHFNYAVGTVDGDLGPRSRAAISEFQSEMGFYPDGTLEEHERAFLVGSHQRAVTGNIGQHSNALIQGGARGLLRSFNSERLGTFAAAPVAPVAPVAPPATAPVAAATGSALPGLPGLPSVTVGETERSMGRYCDETNQISVASGRIQDASNLSNPSQALGEQFCLARSFSTAKGETTMSAVQGMTQADLRGLCDAVVAAVAPVTGTLASRTPDAAIEAVRLIGAGRTPAEMISLGEICLGIGFLDDAADVSLAAALVLAAAGKPAYGEFVGHQLREGFGVAPDATAAMAWHWHALGAIDGGATAEILPGQAGARGAVLRAALGAAPAPSAELNASGGGGLPSLTLTPPQN